MKMIKNVLIFLALAFCLTASSKAIAQSNASYIIDLVKKNAANANSEATNKNDGNVDGNHNKKQLPAKKVFSPTVYYFTDDATLQFVGQSTLEAFSVTIADQAGLALWSSVLSLKQAQTLSVPLPIIPQSGDRLTLTIGSDVYIGDF